MVRMRYLDKVNKIQEKSHSHRQTKLLCMYISIYGLETIQKNEI